MSQVTSEIQGLDTLENDEDNGLSEVDIERSRGHGQRRCGRHCSSDGFVSLLVSNSMSLKSTLVLFYKAGYGVCMGFDRVLDEKLKKQCWEEGK